MFDRLFLDQYILLENLQVQQD